MQRNFVSGSSWPGAVVLVLALSASGCGHKQEEPPPLTMVKPPSANARAAFEKVRNGLGGTEDLLPGQSEVGAALVAVIRARPGDQKKYGALVNEFVESLRCRSKGCYAVATQAARRAASRERSSRAAFSLVRVRNSRVPTVAARMPSSSARTS